MFVILLILLVGVVIYFLWRHQPTTLTRNCRWRQDRGRGVWRCAYCGAETVGDRAPRDCLRFK